MQGGGLSLICFLRPNKPCRPKEEEESVSFPTTNFKKDRDDAGKAA